MFPINTFIFALAAAISGIGGAMFVLQVGFISPSLVGIVPSIDLRRGRREAFPAARFTERCWSTPAKARRDIPTAMALRDGRSVHRGGDVDANGLAGVWSDYAKPWFAGARKMS